MQSLKTEIGAEIRNANGALIRKVPFRRCHSLLKQFIQLLYCQMSQTATTIKDTSGVEHSRNPESASFGAAGAGGTSKGIVIGTGTTAVTMTDYQVETQLITNIAYAASSLAVENPDSATWRVAISRGFTNNTGAEVTVREVGLYVNQSAYPYYVCIDRTLYPVSFAAGETLTLTYRITISL